jgi:hypothetical protein
MQQPQWVTISVFNTTGKMVMRKSTFMDAGKSNYNLDVSMFEEGFYIMSLTAGEQQLHTQFVVTR